MILEGGNYSVYVHTNKINNMVYVGTTSKVPAYRRWGLTGIHYKRNRRFYDDILKFGWDNFEHEIIASGLNQQEAENMERILINKLESTNPEKGYNIEHGGLSNNEKERCSKISETLKKNHPKRGKSVSEETKKRIGDAMRGEKGYWYGKKLPPETLEKMSVALKGRVIETEKFLEHAEKVRKPVICIETGEKYSSIKEASIKLNVNHVPISRAVNGKQETAYDLHWKFI